MGICFVGFSAARSSTRISLDRGPPPTRPVNQTRATPPAASAERSINRSLMGRRLGLDQTGAEDGLGRPSPPSLPPGPLPLALVPLPSPPLPSLASHPRNARCMIQKWGRSHGLQRAAATVAKGGDIPSGLGSCPRSCIGVGEADELGRLLVVLLVVPLALPGRGSAKVCSRNTLTLTSVRRHSRAFARVSHAVLSSSGASSSSSSWSSRRRSSSARSRSSCRW